MMKLRRAIVNQGPHEPFVGPIISGCSVVQMNEVIGQNRNLRFCSSEWLIIAKVEEKNVLNKKSMKKSIATLLETLNACFTLILPNSKAVISHYWEISTKIPVTRRKQLQRQLH